MFVVGKYEAFERIWKGADLWSKIFMTHIEFNLIQIFISMLKTPKEFTFISSTYSSEYNSHGYIIFTVILALLDMLMYRGIVILIEMILYMIFLYFCITRSGLRNLG